MKVKRCTKCKYFRKSRAKTKVYDHGNGIRISQTAPTIIDVLSIYYCKNRWWNVGSRSFFREGDVCDDFEFKAK